MPHEPKMIVIDDDRRLLSLYKRIFDAFSVKVYFTQNSKDAIRVAMYSKPDIFMTDLIHPGVNGFKMIKDFRKNKYTKEMSIWVVSGSLDTMSQDELRELDADEIFCKPVRLERLIEKAEKIFKSTNKDAALLNLGCEAPDLDYKSDIDLKSKEGRASFAKDVIAFANNGGGHIIVGVSEPKKGLFEKTGVTEAEAEKFEVTNINKAIADYIEPQHHISSRRVYEGRKCFHFISIPGVTVEPLLARKENADARLFLGRIYIRTSSAETKEVTRSEELRKIWRCAQRK